MAGHSKWATTKRKKAAIDAKRGKIFTKLAKNITVAAKAGGDPDMNPALRTAIEQAKGANMPKDNIEKAIAKGAGTGEGDGYEELLYEGYAPGGVALIIECVTDNTNRTVSNVRSILTKAGGSLGNSGSVQYLFDQKGIIAYEQAALGGVNGDEFELAAIDAGAEDIDISDEGIMITTARTDLFAVEGALRSGFDVAPTEASIRWIPQSEMPLDEAAKKSVVNLIEQLEEDDDVDAVYTNLAE